MSLQHFKSEMFTNSNTYVGKSNTRSWGCLRAALALAASSVGLASCVAVIACGIAVTGWILAYDAYRNNCLN